MYLLRNIHYHDLDSDILMVVISTITEIAVVLNDTPNSKWDFIFYPTSYYATLLTAGFLRPRHPNIVSAVPTLLEALRNYKVRRLGEGIPSLEKILEIPNFLDMEWWDFLKLPEEKPTSVYASKTGSRLPNLSSLSLPTPYAEGNDSE